MINKSEKGSATIEAIVSLSIFIFAFVAVYSIVNMCLVQAQIQQALNKSAKEISQYYYLVDKLNLTDTLSNGLSEQSQAALGVLDSFETVLSDGRDVADKVGETVNTVNISNIQSSIDSIKGLETSAKDLANTLGEVANNPFDYAKSFAALAAQNVAEDVKNKVAEMLARNMSKRHFEGVNLESMGVRGGYEGMNFGQSRILQKDNQEEIKLVVVYELELADFLPFDFSITISQSAKTRGWAGE